MTTTITSIIDPDNGVGTDYTSLDAWEDDLGNSTNGNLVSADEIVVAQCRSSSGTADTAAVVIDGWTTGVNNYIQIEAYAEHKASPTFWDTNKYRLQVTDAPCITFTEEYINVDGLQIEPLYSSNDGTMSAIFGTYNGGVYKISNCRLNYPGGTSIKRAIGIGSSGNGTVYIWNCIMTGFERASYAVNDYEYVYNCTAYNCTSGFTAWSSQLGGAYINCVVAGATNSDFGDVSGNITIDHCAGEDGTGTNPVYASGSDWDNEFVDKDNGNFALLSGGNCVDGGTNDPGSGLFSDDMKGVARTNTWDIGAFEWSGRDIVSNLVIPKSLGGDGFASDGAWHVESDNNQQAIITWDRTRIRPVVIDHKPMFFSGATPTDHLIGHWKCDDNVASTTVLDNTGLIGNGTLVGGDNTEDISSLDAPRGRSLLLDGTADRIDLPQPTSGDYDWTTWRDEFTVLIKFKPNFSYDTGIGHALYSLRGITPTEVINIIYANGVDMFKIDVDLDGSTESVYTEQFTNDNNLKQWHTIMASISFTRGVFFLTFDSKVCSCFYTSQSWTATVTSYHRIGYSSYGAYGAEFIGEVMLLKGCILPFGAPITLYDQVGDYSKAHSSITFLWKGSDTTPIGSDVTSNGDYTQDLPSGNKGFRNDAAGEYASAPTSGNINASEGTLGFWFQPNSALGADCTLLYAASDFKIWWDDSDNDIVFTYNTNTVRMTTAFPADDVSSHYVKIKWKASSYLEIIVEGSSGTDSILVSGVDAAPTLDATMYFTADDASGTNRANILMGDLWIADSINCPEAWSDFGKELWTKQLSVA